MNYKARSVYALQGLRTGKTGEVGPGTITTGRGQRTSQWSRRGGLATVVGLDRYFWPGFMDADPFSGVRRPSASRSNCRDSVSNCGFRGPEFINLTTCSTQCFMKHSIIRPNRQVESLPASSSTSMDYTHFGHLMCASKD